MPRRSSSSGSTPASGGDRIVDIDVDDEMRSSFLEYAYSVIYSRALPDARDGLKPVQRRILFQMAQMGLSPDRGHVKSARVVGEVMGRLHPHGDSAIYDALVRMAQPFSLRLPFVDGHGNFGSPDDGPAAMRYTECRLAPAALAMTTGLDEDVVDLVANYDGREREPSVLPAAIPALLVNGAAGIAVGMATALPPHNLGEVMAAAHRLALDPDVDTDTLLRLVPGPDLPGGGTIVGLEGIRDAYLTGRGSFRMRATARVEQVSPRRRGIVVTELPYGVGPERVIEKVKDLVTSKRLQGISDIVDLTDGDSGLRLVIEVRPSVNPEAVLADLYRLTPMEDTFSINSVALVDGEPQTLSLRAMLEVFVDHRLTVTRRRSEYRRRRAQERLHLVEGLLIAIVDIDEVIEVIRSSDDASAARDRLISVFDLTVEQATYILDMPLRRLTRFSRIELESEREDLQAAIEELLALLADEGLLRAAVAADMAAVAEEHATPRRTVVLEAVGSPAALPLEVPDDPCHVLLSSTGLIARTADPALPQGGPRGAHDVVVAATEATARGEIGLVTSRGRIRRLSVVELPALAPLGQAPHLSGGAPLGALTELDRGERVVGLCPIDSEMTLVLATRFGTVKRVSTEAPSAKPDWDLIALAEGDAVIGCAPAPDDSEIVLVTSDAQALRFPASAVRRQGRAAAGMAGIRLGEAAEVVFGGAVSTPDTEACIVTVAAPSAALPGTVAGSVKISDLSEIPAKGRGTGGVRVHRFVRGEDHLTVAWVGPAPPLAGSPSGMPIDLPDERARRDASGSPLQATVGAIAGPVRPSDR